MGPKRSSKKSFKYHVEIVVPRLTISWGGGNGLGRFALAQSKGQVNSRAFPLMRNHGGMKPPWGRLGGFEYLVILSWKAVQKLDEPKPTGLQRSGRNRHSARGEISNVR